MWPDYAQFYFTPTNARVSDVRATFGGDLVLFFTHALGGSGALQVLSLACLAGGCVLLRRLYRGPMNGWLTALLVAVALGTYQLQLPRNAVFSLPLTALVFFLFAKYRETRRGTWAWSLPVVVAIWSVLHASSLLGLVLVAVLLGVDALEGLRISGRELWKRMGRALLLAGVSLAVVSVGNPTATRLLRRPTDGIFHNSSAEPRATAKKQSVKSAPLPPAPPPRNAKEWLNNLIWPVTPGQVRSADFSSPLDRLEYRPVGVAFALMALAAAWALWARQVRLPYLAAYLATAVLGLSYFRMTGYAALGSAALILSSGPLRGRVAEALGKSSWLGAALAGGVAAGLWGSWLTGNLASVIGNSRHVVGIGKVPTFDENATRWLLEKHQDARVFTTIVTGSFALHEWRWKKPVFIDGFFAPHAASVWADYIRARREPERDVLRERYGIDFALVEHTRQDWNGVFLAQPEWQPAAIGAGCIVYGHRSVLGEAAPELLFDVASAETMPPYFRRALARNYYGALLSILAAERPAAGQRLIAASPDAYQRWRRWLSPAERAAVREMDAAFREVEQ